MRNCLRKKAIEIKKSFKVCTATADLVFLFADRDDLKKREVKIISQDEPSNSEWKEEDDAVLVALSLLYANERYSLRELNVSDNFYILTIAAIIFYYFRSNNSFIFFTDLSKNIK